jgi:hypothetical protein
MMSDIVTRTNWDLAILEDLIGKKDELTDGGILKTSFPDDFTNGMMLIRLQHCMDDLNKIGLSTGAIEAVIQEDVNQDLPANIKNAAKSKYDENEWIKIAKPHRNELREKQRKALVAYTLAHAEFDPGAGKYERWKDTNELYEYLLIDVEMKPISMTSRIKQAISSVQLYIDRVLMNLEHPNSDPSQTVLKLDGDQVEEWSQWRKIYRIWEANRKIFLYAENWIEEELRDDKSPFFIELENSLKQNELNEENVENAYYSYLERLDEVSRLEIVGLHHQQEDATEDEPALDIVHVIARSSGNPAIYYHRTLEKGEWTSWIKLDIDVDGDHIIPVIFNRRLCLFWLFLAAENEETNDSLASEVPRYFKVQVAWSEYKNNKWVAKRLSKAYLETTHVPTNAEMNQMKEDFYVKAVLSSGKLSINVSSSKGFVTKSSFIFNSTQIDPIVTTGLGHYFYNGVWVSVDDSNAAWQMIRANNEKQSFAIRKEIDDIDGGIIVEVKELEILEECTEDYFKLVTPVDDPQPYEKHFFFQDARHTFYVLHSMKAGGLLAGPEISFGEWNNAIKEHWWDLIEAGGYGYDVPVHPDVISDPDVYYGSIDHNAEKLAYFGGSYEENPSINTPVTNIGVESGESIIANVSLLREGLLNPNLSNGFSTLEFEKGLLHKFEETDHYTFITFYHDHVKTFMKNLNKLGIKGLLKRSVQTQDDTINFRDTYSPTSIVNSSYPTSEIDFEYGGPYAQYNWELFFHAPMLIANKLMNDQRFEEARKWYHYVFDPTKSEGGDKERFWQFKPFYDEAGKDITTLDELLRDNEELSRQVEKWMADPFKPHVIARMRIGVYMRSTVMKYLDNLIAWGDQLFRRDSIESINEATNLYILAAKILGPRPEKVPERALRADESFDSIKDDLDAFSNALVQIETFISPSTSSSGVGFSSTGPGVLGEMFYFCVPKNEYIIKYWDTVEDRLFKIRHSMNIKGIVRTLPLFEPPIDPGMLVRAAAAGMDLSSILSDLNAVLPHYRFVYMVQKAKEFTKEVQQLGNALLQSLEKKDAEGLAMLKSAHELKVLEAAKWVREKQIDDAKEALETAKYALEAAKLKEQYFSSREFMNSFEIAHLTSMQVGLILSAIQGGINTIGGVLSAIPNFKIGAPTSMGATFGGDNLGAVLQAISSSIGVAAGINSTIGTMASTMGSYQRRMEEWVYQAETAAVEIQQNERQVISAEIKLSMAEKELENHEMQVENTQEVDDYMHDKFTNQELYEWMIGQISSIYFQSYQMAYDLAKQAEQCYQYELGLYDETSFIQFGYWDSLKKGLLSAEKLQYDLARMEKNYLSLNEREYELTKHISLLILNPKALLDLRTKGKCSFVVPEALYDLDYQSHYFRRIKSVSLSIPCIAGPYTTIACTLRQKDHSIRLRTPGSDAYDDYTTDGIRKVTMISSVATSTAQNDSGLFELNFRDDRYLPFEGTGVFGEWELVLNEHTDLRMFDYNTISDVIMHIKYSARNDDVLKPVVETYLSNLIRSTVAPTGSTAGIELFRMFSCKHEFSSAWYKLFNPSDGNEQMMEVEITQDRFPYYTRFGTIKIKSVSVYGYFNTADDYTVELTSGSGAATKQTFALTGSGNYLDTKNVSSLSYALGNFILKVKKTADADYTSLSETDVRDLIIVMDYQVE